MSDEDNKALDDLIDRMLAWSADDRVEAFKRISAVYCEHCGYQQPKGNFCQCNNDE